MTVLAWLYVLNLKDSQSTQTPIRRPILINGYNNNNNNNNNNNTVDCIYPWTHSCKTCFRMTSNVWASGVKVWSFPAQMWSIVLNDFRNCTLIFAQLLRKNNPAQVLSLDSAKSFKVGCLSDNFFLSCWLESSSLWAVSRS